MSEHHLCPAKFHRDGSWKDEFEVCVCLLLEAAVEEALEDAVARGTAVFYRPPTATEAGLLIAGGCTVLAPGEHERQQEEHRVDLAAAEARSAALLNNAIKALAAAGGGTLELPAGVWNMPEIALPPTVTLTGGGLREDGRTERFGVSEEGS